MELCGRWWDSDVARQVHETLTDRERARRRVFQGRSPQLSFRRQLVDWITTIAERHKLGLTSLHLAVYLLDFFMDNFDVSRNQLNLVAMGCLSVSSKFEEKEEDIPKQNVLSHYCSGAYAASDFLQMELMLLKFYDWEVGLVTPAHFINFYVHSTCAETQTEMRGANNETVIGTVSTLEQQQIADSVKSYARYFMSVCIQYHHFHDYHPSVIAAASVCATRYCLNLIPVFPNQLQDISPYSESQLVACQRDLLLIHDRDKNRVPTDIEPKRSKPETSTPEGTPDGAHMSTKQNRGQKDDSQYNSDLSLDSDPDSLQIMDTATTEEDDDDDTATVKQPRPPTLASVTTTSRVRTPSCSPIRGEPQPTFPQQQQPQQQRHHPSMYYQQQQPLHQQQHVRRNGVSVGSSEEDCDEGERMSEGRARLGRAADGDERMADEEQFSAPFHMEDRIAETIEIDSGDDMMVYSTMPEMEAKASSLVESYATSVGSFATSKSRAFGVGGNDDVVDLVDDEDDADDSSDDVVVISEGKRRETKMTNDSGVGIVADDLGAEEECYDEVTEDGEVFIEELQPPIHPSIRRSSTDSFVYVDAQNKSHSNGAAGERGGGGVGGGGLSFFASERVGTRGSDSSSSSSTFARQDSSPSTMTTMTSTQGNGVGPNAFLSNNGTFHVVAMPFVSGS